MTSAPGGSKGSKASSRCSTSGEATGVSKANFSALPSASRNARCSALPDGSKCSQNSLPKGVHLPYFYVAKGRMCRPGAMAVTGTERFAVGRRCRKECLTLAATTARPGRSDNWPTLHVGNALLSRHSPEMSRTLRAAAGEGAIERVIVPGEPL